MKRWRKMIALLLSMVILWGCVPEAPDPSAPSSVEGSIGTEFVPDTDQEELFSRLFDLRNKIQIRIDMSDEELKKMQSDYDHYSSFGSKSPIYRKADVTIVLQTAAGNETYVIEEVGVRMKGNTSRTPFYSPEAGIYNAIHLKLSFQETFDDPNYYGNAVKQWPSEESRRLRKERTFATLEKLELRWNRCDDGSYLKEYYAYEIYRAFGVLSPHVNLASLDWSGVHMGVYTINEPVDKVFLEKQLPAQAQGGDLYKLGWADWVNASFTDTGSIGIEDPDAGRFYAFDLKTNKKTSTHQSLTALIRQLNDGDVTKEAFADLVDVPYFLNYAAISYMLGNPDDLRNNYNNCYIYFRPDTGKMLVIPYDYDRCLGITAHWNPTHTGLTDDNPFTDELLSVDRNDSGADRSQKNPLYLYSVVAGGYYVADYARILESVASSEWFGQERFARLYAVAQGHYRQDALPDKRLQNTEGLKMAFDLERTSDFAAYDNISYSQYILTKQATLAYYLERVDAYIHATPQQRPVYYVRGDFTGWQNSDHYAMQFSDGRYTCRVVAAGQVRLKVYYPAEDSWYGAECIPEDCQVPFETDGHTNVVLPAGTYIIIFDPNTGALTLTKEA